MTYFLVILGALILFLGVYLIIDLITSIKHYRIVTRNGELLDENDKLLNDES